MDEDILGSERGAVGSGPRGPTQWLAGGAGWGAAGSHVCSVCLVLSIVLIVTHVNKLEENEVIMRCNVCRGPVALIQEPHAHPPSKWMETRRPHCCLYN